MIPVFDNDSLKPDITRFVIEKTNLPARHNSAVVYVLNQVDYSPGIYSLDQQTSKIEFFRVGVIKHTNMKKFQSMEFDTDVAGQHEVELFNKELTALDASYHHPVNIGIMTNWRSEVINWIIENIDGAWTLMSLLHENRKWGCTFYFASDEDAATIKFKFG
jgi:hypothetical protein